MFWLSKLNAKCPSDMDI